MSGQGPVYFNPGCGCGPGAPPPYPVPPGNPCTPQQASTASQIEQLIYLLFGTLTPTIVDGRVTYTSTCSATPAIEGFAPNPGEGTLCYILRVLSSQAIQMQPYATSIGQAEGIPTQETLPDGSIVGILNAVNANQLSYYVFHISNTRPAANAPSIFYPTDNPLGYFIIST